MIDISVTGLVKEFEVGKKILDGLSFQINSGERVGLLGPNGCGKTTVLRILTGVISCDEGEVTIASGKRLGLISQIPVYPDGYTVEDVLDTAFAPLREMEQTIAQLTKQMEQDQTPALLAQYDTLAARFQSEGGYETEINKNKVCNGLSISEAMRGQLFDLLSGGEKTRVNLARLILENTDILLLDEPTNHLDLRSTEWLEDFLGKFKGTVLTVSHDRYFLDRVIQRVIEIQNGKAEYYAGNYSFFAAERVRRYEERLRQYEKEQAEINRLMETARKMHEHNTEHLHKRAFSIEKRIERLKTVDKPPQERRLKARFRERAFLADEFMTITGLEKSFGDRLLFQNVDLEIVGGERIALLGDNGVGKSTLLNIIMGTESADRGKIRTGPTVKIGYLPQQIRFRHPERNLVDTMIYEQNCTPQEAHDRLAAFRFRGEDVWKPVSALSGGEQSRLRLCMLMDETINLLILDEPTNHLDISSREWIEEAVEAYEGNLLFVSHDRYFINRFADRIWLLEQEMITDFRGGYQKFHAWRERESMAQQPSSPAADPKEKKGKPRHTGGTKNLEKEVSAAERAVEQAEKQMDALLQEIEAAATDYMTLQELYARRDALEEEILKRYETWERLSAALEGISHE